LSKILEHDTNPIGGNIFFYSLSYRMTTTTIKKSFGEEFDEKYTLFWVDETSRIAFFPDKEIGQKALKSLENTNWRVKEYLESENLPPEPKTGKYTLKKKGGDGIPKPKIGKIKTLPQTVALTDEEILKSNSFSLLDNENEDIEKENSDNEIPIENENETTQEIEKENSNNEIPKENEIETTQDIVKENSNNESPIENKNETTQEIEKEKSNETPI